MKKLQEIIKIIILSILLLIIGTSVFAREIQINNSTIYNWALDVYKNEYSRTLIQDNIINATCNWSYNGCAVQIPLSESITFSQGRNYKITIAVSVPKGTQIFKGSWGKNVSFELGSPDSSNRSLWRLHQYVHDDYNNVINADFNYTLQSTAANVDIYSLDYSFKASNIGYSVDIISLLFALNSTNQLQTGTLKFSYIMLDATNEDVVKAVNDLKSNIDDVKNSVDDVNKSINDTSVPNFDQNKFLGYLPENALSAILNLPLNVLNSIQSNLTSSTCNDLVLPLPYLNNKSIKLECVSKLYQKMGFTNLVNWIGTLLGAFMLYNYLINLYKWVDGVLTFRENNWEGYD